METSVGVERTKEGEFANTWSMPSPTTSSYVRKSWKIPMVPPSMNKLYAINYRTKSVYMTKEARDFKTKVKMFMTSMLVSSTDRFNLQLDVHTNWLCKNGAIRKADIHNMIKVVVDAVSERLGFDDAQVFSFTANKIQSTENYCTVTLEKQNEKISNVEKV